MSLSVVRTYLLFPKPFMCALWQPQLLKHVINLQENIFNTDRQRVVSVNIIYARISLLFPFQSLLPRVDSVLANRPWLTTHRLRSWRLEQEHTTWTLVHRRMRRVWSRDLLRHRVSQYRVALIFYRPIRFITSRIDIVTTDSFYCCIAFQRVDW